MNFNITKRCCTQAAIRSTEHTYDIFLQNTLMEIKSSFNQASRSNSPQEIQGIFKKHVELQHRDGINKTQNIENST